MDHSPITNKSSLVWKNLDFNNDFIFGFIEIKFLKIFTPCFEFKKQNYRQVEINNPNSKFNCVGVSKFIGNNVYIISCIWIQLFQKATIENKSDRLKNYLIHKNWDPSYENEIKQIAVEGVISFFNAVSKTKKEMKETLKKRTSYEKQKLLKRESKKKFLNKVSKKV